MNTRLQVEHPVTEQVAGVDLVRAQLLVAAGQPLPWTQDELAQRGHAIEARVYAEDPSQGFLPQAGRLARYREPRRPGIRVDAGIVEGGEVTVYYDPMIAKVIATAETRPLAIARLAAALREFKVEGIRTNIAFLVAILESTEFRAGAVDTAWLDRDGAALSRQVEVQPEAQPHVPGEAPLTAQAGSRAYRSVERRRRGPRLDSGANGGPAARERCGRRRAHRADAGDSDRDSRASPAMRSSKAIRSCCSRR